MSHKIFIFQINIADYQIKINWNEIYPNFMNVLTKFFMISLNLSSSNSSSWNICNKCHISIIYILIFYQLFLWEFLSKFRIQWFITIYSTSPFTFNVYHSFSLECEFHVLVFWGTMTINQWKLIIHPESQFQLPHKRMMESLIGT